MIKGRREEGSYKAVQKSCRLIVSTKYEDNSFLTKILIKTT